jgi:hypothetical protein
LQHDCSREVEEAAAAWLPWSRNRHARCSIISTRACRWRGPQLATLQRHAGDGGAQLAQLTLVEAVNHALRALQDDPAVIVFGEDVAATAACSAPPTA